MGSGRGKTRRAKAQRFGKVLTPEKSPDVAPAQQKLAPLGIGEENSDVLQQVGIEIHGGLLSVLVPETESRMTLCNESEMTESPLWFAALSDRPMSEGGSDTDVSEAIISCVGERHRGERWVEELARLAERSYA